MKLEQKQRVFICRHGETEWSRSGQHTSTTDLPLTDKGEKQVEALAKRLEGIEFTKVFCSPLLRARQTCEIAGLMGEAVIDDDLFEWRYGDYEGIKTVDIRKTVPNWSVFTHGCPNGESVEDVKIRADNMIEKIQGIDGDVAIFSSGHFSRVLTARWLNLPVVAGRHFILNTGTLSILTFEREAPAIKMWNA